MFDAAIQCIFQGVSFDVIWWFFHELSEILLLMTEITKIIGVDRSNFPRIKSRKALMYKKKQ